MLLNVVDDDNIQWSVNDVRHTQNTTQKTQNTAQKILSLSLFIHVEIKLSNCDIRINQNETKNKY